MVQVGQVEYANWGHVDARDKETRPLAAGDFYFKETFIQGEPGQKLTLEIKNIAEQVHNFSISAQGLDRDIPPKSDRVDIAVIFPQNGGLQFFCKYHTALGMNGLLAVGGARPRCRWPAPHRLPAPSRRGNTSWRFTIERSGGGTALWLTRS